MTIKGLTATILQLIGIYFLCDVITSGMSFVTFSSGFGDGLSADWVKIWKYNLIFWGGGLLLSLALIFLASPIASFLCSLTTSEKDTVIGLEKISSEVLVQFLAIVLLFRQLYFAVVAVPSLFQFSQGFMESLVIALYFVGTIGASIWLLLRPDLLRRLSSSRVNKSQEE